ncbi:LADA_0C05996g1_1 [Lachancea dasiensis]|uniref:LADA_0C05996g1_1 n=1 Tax=Lachancea dasiensis TaxID=1072105 RepID=A0A1G4IZJ1_9SACH|nr:LADA_0C05996g1_1 [Lachancea dasiensis]
MHRVCLTRRYSSYKAPRSSSLIDISTSEAYQDSLSQNRTLRRLVDAYKQGKFKVVDSHEDLTSSLNSSRSLPMIQFPKNQVFQEVLHDSSVGEWRKPMTKWLRLGKKVLKMYLNGIRDTWKVYRDSRGVLTKFNANEPIVTHLYRDLEFQQIENRHRGEGPSKLAITRSEFQEVHRMKEVWKLPTFFLLLLIFEEAVPIICYLLPSVVPWNCLTPGAFKKLSQKRISSQNKLPYAKSFDTLPKYASPYSIPLEDVKTLLRTFRVAHRWKVELYHWSGNRTAPSELLALFHQYLVLDDWLLLQSIFDEGEATLLCDKELVNAIVERQLFYAGEDLNILVSSVDGRKLLVWRLFIYWAFRFDGSLMAGGSKTFSELWGVNNIGILNFPGSRKLMDTSNLETIETLIICEN